jgi:excinuclease ABC subunit A
VGGGKIVAATDPEGLSRVAASHTGAALRPVLARAQNDTAVSAGEGTNG